MTAELNDTLLLLAGILIALSAFLMLYKSYQARGYLEYLGQRARRGTLPEADLPLTGWPGRRVQDWWREIWASPWLGKAADLLEPWMFLPWLFVFMWAPSRPPPSSPSWASCWCGRGVRACGEPERRHP